MSRRFVLGAVLAWLPFAPQSAAGQSEFRYEWYAFTQPTLERLSEADGVEFGVDRARVNLQASLDRWSARAQVDLAADDLGERPPGTLPNLVQDLHVDYRFTAGHAVRLGQFKTPLGMDFNTPDSQLDIAKRGMEVGLVLNRILGAMVTGERPGGLSYAVGIFNPAGRSSATLPDDSNFGNDNVGVVRARYARDQWHVEGAYGDSPEAGGLGTATYRVADFGFRYEFGSWVTKLEWIEGRSLFGVEGRDERVGYVHAGRKLSPRLDLVVRHYDGESSILAGTTRLTNTYFGATVHLLEHERLQTRLQVNYVVARRDRGAYTGVRGYTDDALLLQLQLFVR